MLFSYSSQQDRVDQNIIGTPKIPNILQYTVYLYIFKNWTFLYCSPFSYIALPTLRQKSFRPLTSLLHFLYRFSILVQGFFSVFSLYSHYSTNYRCSDSCCSFSILKAIAKSKGELIAIAFKSNNYRHCNCWKSNKYRKGNKGEKQRNYALNEAKLIKRNSFTRSNRKKINIVIAILEKLIISHQ